MRVIAGSAGGTRLKVPKTKAVRPMTDRVKESLFSHLHQRPAGAVVLDLFAGSGSLAIEALSRGAGRAVLVESSRAARAAARENLRRCGLAERAEVVACEVKRFLERAQPAAPFDLVFVDPPYSMEDEDLVELLESLVPLLSAGAAVCLHREKARLRRRPKTAGSGREAPRSRGVALLPWPRSYRVVFERSLGGAVVGVAEIAG